MRPLLKKGDYVEVIRDGKGTGKIFIVTKDMTNPTANVPTIPINDVDSN